MDSSKFITIPVNSVPTHIVVWQDSKMSSENVELKQIIARIDTMEKTLQRLLTQSSSESPKVNFTVPSVLQYTRPWNSPMLPVTLSPPLDDSEVSSIASSEKPSRSPYFTATHVSEPIGLEVHRVPSLSLQEQSKEEEKTVTLNGFTFSIHKWNGSVIFCEENTGRAFLNPQDAFSGKEPIGYWDSSLSLLQPKKAQDVEEVEIDWVKKEEEEVQVEEVEEKVEEKVEEVEEVEEKVEEVEEKVEEVEEKEEEVEEKEEEQEEEEEEVEEKEEEVEEQEEEQEEEKEEEVEEQEEEEVEEQEEEEGLELEEFEFKGVTYYRDPDNQVYEANAEGEIQSEPIGVWNEQKQKVLRYPK